MTDILNGLPALIQSMMKETETICLVLAGIVFVIGAMVTWSYRKWRHVLLIPTAFGLAMLYILLIPYNKEAGLGFFDKITTVLQVTVLNAGYHDLVGDGVQSLKPSISHWLIMALCILLPIMALGTLAQFLRGVTSWWQWRLPFRTENWFFSAFSDKAYALARNAREQGEKRVRMVFCATKEDDYERLREIGVIPFTRSLEELRNYHFRRKPSVVLFMKEDDAENLDDALDFIKSSAIRSRKNCKWKQKKRILLYISTCRPEAELLLNSPDIAQTMKEKGILCRRIVKTRSAVYREMQEVHAELDRRLAEKEGPCKRLSVVLAGFGWMGSEILKAYLWMYSRSDCIVEVHVLDRDITIDRFRQMCPGITDLGNGRFRVPYSNIKTGEGEAYSTVEFIPVPDFYTLNLEKAFPDIRKADVIYVAMGEDARNMECAIYLRNVLRRMRLNELGINAAKDELLQPPIRVAVKNPATRKFSFTDRKGNDYNIKPFAGSAGYYAVNTLFNYELEKWALAAQFCYGFSMRTAFEKDEELLRKCYNADGPVSGAEELVRAFNDVQRKKLLWLTMLRYESMIPDQEISDMDFVTQFLDFMGSTDPEKKEEILTGLLSRLKGIKTDVKKSGTAGNPQDSASKKNKGNVRARLRLLSRISSALRKKKKTLSAAQGKEIDFLQEYLTSLTDGERHPERLSHHIEWRRLMLEGNLVSTAEEFYERDYNGRSNRASALYAMCNARRLWEKEYAGICSKDAWEEFCTWREIHREEHRRWNIYMLTEGYVDNSPNLPEGHYDEDKLIRDDISGLHNNIIPFEDLKGITRMLDVI